MYSGTLTFTVPEGQTITSIVFSVNTGKWNVNNSADSGEFEGQTWTGSAQSVTVSIGGNTQINSIVVTVEGGSVEPVEEDVLVVLPAGIEAEAWTIEGIYSTDEDDESVSEATEVAFDGTDIYVKGLAYYFPDAWLKGTIANGVATFPNGQFVGEDEYGKEYMVGCDDGETVCDIQFAYDAGAQTLTQLTEYIVENADTKTEIYCYGWWTDVQLYAGAPEQLEPVVAPENLATEPYLFKAMAMEASYDEEEETAFEEYDTQVSVGFDGDDLYIQGLAADLPEGWVKATKNGNGQYIIPANQYMGTLDFHGLFSFDYFFTAVDEDENLMDVVLTVDPETGTITCDQILALNESRNALDYYLLFKDVVMTKIPEVAAVPADPTVDEIATGEEVNYPHVDFIIPAKSVDGQPLIQSLLSYQIFIEKNGEVQPLTLTAELYKYFTEDMTVIPYTYEDSYDIYAGGERVYLNQDREEIQTWSKLGVQSIYTAAGETNKSNIVWANVNDITDVISVMNTDNQKAQYFDLSGRAVSAPQKGLFIKQVSLQDGSVKAVKVLRK
jgi:hypothetical protein